jgi:hypothetical protein
MLVMALTVCAGAVWLVARAARRGGDEPGRAGLIAIVVLGVWLGGWGYIGNTGMLAQFGMRPPPFVLLVVAVLLASFRISLSRLGLKLSRLPLAVLVGFQAFRLPLELVMHRAASEGIMPMQMSFSGYNFDILTGITAILVAWLVKRGKGGQRLVLAWNVLGFLLLLNILSIAIASTPVFRAFGDSPDRVNTWVAYFPYVYLPTVMVVAAFAGHIIIFRRLLADARGD